MKVSSIRLAEFKALTSKTPLQSEFNPNFYQTPALNNTAKMPDTLSFLGAYYAETDAHARVPMVASTLSEIERRIQEDKSDEPVFLLDCGDFFGESYSFKSIGDIYSTFQKRNPNVTSVFTLGNYDLSALLGWGIIAQHQKPMIEAFEKMSDAGINFVSATYPLVVEELEKQGMEVQKFDNIKPYIILDDVADGKPQKVFVTAVGVSEIDRGNGNALPKKKALDYALEAARRDGFEPSDADKTIILLHESQKEGREVIKYAKEDLGLRNVELVVGGHPHSIDDFTMGKTRVIYPPAQGKGAYVLKSREQGFDFEPLKLKQSGYDYSPLADKNPGIINNSDINKPLFVRPAYAKIVNNPQNAEFLRIVADEAPYSLDFRNYDAKLSSPTTFGTFMANSYRDILGCEFALSRNQLVREKLPSKGKSVNWYNICDSVNIDNSLYRLKLNTDKLKEVLEVSLKKQDTGITNSPFLEYSDNLRITRKGDAGQDEDKIVQIELFENGAWTKLLDEKGKALDSERIFDVATEDALAIGKIGEFKDLNLECEKIEGETMRGILCKALNMPSNPDEPNYHKSEIITV